MRVDAEVGVGVNVGTSAVGVATAVVATEVTWVSGWVGKGLQALEVTQASTQVNKRAFHFIAESPVIIR